MHFTALVKIENEFLKNHDTIEDAVKAMMAPYCECDEEYYKFKDCHDEILKDFANLTKAELEEYENIEEYARDQHYIQKDGRYGYMQNPNGHWDWYEIGGRWPGMLRSKTLTSGRFGTPSWAYKDKGGYKYEKYECDICSFGELDLDKLNEETQKNIERFWKAYQLYLKIMGKDTASMNREEFDARWWVEQELYYMGLRRYKTVDNKQVHEEDPLTYEDLNTKYRWKFHFYTYSVLDKDGWHCGEDFLKEETFLTNKRIWSETYAEKYLKNEKPDTVLVIVDYHT
jgi:hypothetical protein